MANVRKKRKKKKHHGIKEVKKSSSTTFHQWIYGPESGQKTTSEIKIGSYRCICCHGKSIKPRVGTSSLPGLSGRGVPFIICRKAGRRPGLPDKVTPWLLTPGSLWIQITK